MLTYLPGLQGSLSPGYGTNYSSGHSGLILGAGLVKEGFTHSM